MKPISNYNYTHGDKALSTLVASESNLWFGFSAREAARFYYNID
jgi:hypothetical protein